MRIEAISAYVPEEVWSNARVAARLRLERMRLSARSHKANQSALEPEEYKLFQTSDRWVRRFIGFTERRFCREGQGTIDLAVESARQLFARSGHSPDDIDGIVNAGVLPVFPRREKTFKLRVYDRQLALVAEFEAPNPLYRPYPTWKPEDMPATHQAGDLTASLVSLSNRWTVAGYDGLELKRFSLTPEFQLATDWEHYAFAMRAVLDAEPALENVANLERLPPTGAVLIVAPLRLVGGTGSPARVLALVPRTDAADPG
jgi:hypothetical protein